MRSVADDLRREQFERYRRMTPAARVALAQRLGHEGLAAFMRSRGLDRVAALREIRASRHAGRVVSRCSDRNDR